MGAPGISKTNSITCMMHLPSIVINSGFPLSTNSNIPCLKVNNLTMTFPRQYPVSNSAPPGMYHAKHAEAGGKAGARRRRPAKGGASGGEFLGFDDDDSSCSDVEVGEKRERVRNVNSDRLLF